jgi:hypothetical protein
MDLIEMTSQFEKLNQTQNKFLLHTKRDINFFVANSVVINPVIPLHLMHLYRIVAIKDRERSWNEIQKFWTLRKNVKLIKIESRKLIFNRIRVKYLREVYCLILSITQIAGSETFLQNPEMILMMNWSNNLSKKLRNSYT